MATTSAAPSASLIDLGTDRLLALCHAFGYRAAQTRSAVDLFQTLGSSWKGATVDAPPRWPSDITDDHTPFEFSLAIDAGAPEIRFLLEVQGDEPSLASHWEAARAMNRRLAADFGVHLERLAAVEDLFAPTAESRRFAMWHAVCFPLGAAPSFKIYLNPQAGGWSKARSVVEAAMARLGLGEASGQLPASTPHDELCYFSLDLSPRSEARVKVYTAHYNATAAQVDAGVSRARGYSPGKAAEFCGAMGGDAGPYQARPVLTCLSFVEGSVRPAMGTVHFPVRSYARDDGVVRDRVLRYLPEVAPIYNRALDVFSDRELEDGVGLQTYVSLRLEQKHRLTVYLASEAYDVGQVPMTEPKCSGVVERLGRRRGWLAAAGDEND